ncbi:acyl-CoA N-acyltransferase [Aspergillus varians]
MATPPTPILHLPNSKCLIRPFTPTLSEAQTISNEANNPLIAKFMRNAFPHPYSVADAESWIAFTNAEPRHDFTICDAATNTVVGAIGLKPRTDVQHRSMEIGYWLGETHWGKGIATEAVVAFSQWAFEKFEHVVRLEAEVFEGNEGSKRVLEKAGYVCEARKKWAVEKEGVLLDAFIYALVAEGKA